MSRYDDPYAARYERVNISVNAYHKAAIKQTCRRFRKREADLVYRWVFEPESKIAEDSRNYFHQILDSIEAEDIRACA